MVIEGVIFDKDGTLFDFRRSWGGWAKRVLQDLATDADHAAQMGAAIGFDLAAQDFSDDSPVIAGTGHEVAGCLLPHVQGHTQDSLAAVLNAHAAAARMEPAVPLVPFFTGLKGRGLKIGLATNDAQAPALAHLTQHDLLPLFDFVAGYDSGHGGKPAPGQLLAFAAQCGLDPARCVMVGDSLHDLEAGRAAGMRCVAVLTGVAGAEGLAPHADVVLADIGGLPGWLDSLAGA